MCDDPGHVKLVKNVFFLSCHVSYLHFKSVKQSLFPKTKGKYTTDFKRVINTKIIIIIININK